MTSSHGMAEPGYDCDGTTLQSCNTPSTQCGITYYPGSGGGPYSNCCQSNGAGGADIQVCTTSDEDQGLCQSNGTVKCTFQVTITSSSGTTLYSEPSNSSPTTHACDASE